MTEQETETLVMSEADIKKLMRNTLMVAGQELGADGDHWPVVKQTITDLMRDWEELDMTRAANAEMATHLYSELAKMEAAIADCSPEDRAKAEPLLAELRETYDALFSPVEEILMDLTDEEEDEDEAPTEKPIHIRRAEAIIDAMMEEDNG